MLALAGKNNAHSATLVCSLARFMASAAQPLAGRIVTPSVTEAELQRRIYTKEMTKLRRGFKEQLEREVAEQTKQAEAERKNIDAEKAKRRALKEERSALKQKAALAQSQAMHDTKAIERELRLANRQAYEAQLGNARQKYLELMAHTTQGCVTLQNIDQRMALSFFEVPTPWQFEFVPFCAPDSAYWREGQDAIFAPRQVSAARFQEMQTRAESARSALSDSQRQSLADAGIRNLGFSRQDIERAKAAVLSGDSTVITDDEDLVFDEWDEFMDEDNEFDME